MRRAAGTREPCLERAFGEQVTGGGKRSRQGPANELQREQRDDVRRGMCLRAVEAAEREAAAGAGGGELGGIDFGSLERNQPHNRHPLPRPLDIT